MPDIRSPADRSIVHHVWAITLRHDGYAQVAIEEHGNDGPTCIVEVDRGDIEAAPAILTATELRQVSAALVDAADRLDALPGGADA